VTVDSTIDPESDQLLSKTFPDVFRSIKNFEHHLTHRARRFSGYS
jgi:hypothetical protein